MESSPLGDDGVRFSAGVSKEILILGLIMLTTDCVMMAVAAAVAVYAPMYVALDILHPGSVM